MRTRLGKQPEKPQNSDGRRRWLKAIVVLLLLGIVLSLALPPFVRWGIEKWLESQGPVSAEIEDVDINPFAGRLVIHTFLAQREEAPGRMKWVTGSLSIQVWPLWEQRLLVERIVLRNALLTVRREGGTWLVGGLKITPAAGEEPEEGWQFGFDEIVLENVRVILLNGDVRKEIGIVRADIGSMQAWNPRKTGKFDLRLQVAGSPLRLEGNALPFAERPSVDAHLNIDNLPLPWLQPWLGEAGIEIESGSLQVDAAVTGRYAPQENRLHHTFSGTASVSALSATTPGTRARKTMLKWDGEMELAAPRENRAPLLRIRGKLAARPLDLELTGIAYRVYAAGAALDHDFAMGTAQVPDGTPFLLQADGSADGLRVDDLEKGLNLATFQTLEMGKGRMEGTGSFRFGRLRGAGAGLWERPGEEEGEDYQKHLLVAREVVLEEVNLGKGRPFEAAALGIIRPEAIVVRRESGFAFGPWAKEGKEAQRPEDELPSKEGWGFHIRHSNVEEGTVTFLDGSVEPRVNLTLDSLRIEARGLDSNPGAKSRIDLVGRFGSGGALRAEGTVRSFTMHPTLDLRMEMENFSLPRITAYAERHLGYAVRSGNMNMKTDLNIHQGKLDSTARVRLVRLELEPRGSREKDAAEKELGFPLNAGLAMLRDGDGVIELTIPITGSVEDPQFGIANIVQKALFKAVKTAALTYFSPVGAVAALGKKFLFDPVMALRFAPVHFPPGRTDLLPEAQEQLTQVAERLEDRPKVNLVVCGVVVPEDIEAVAETSPTAEEIVDIARQRAEAVREFLSARGIDRGRLVRCAPDVDREEGAAPRVEIGI